MTIGFIGQGWIGKNYADNLEKRGFSVVRYALEEPYAKNKDAIKDCDIVFIAVPTPTTPHGFDLSAVREAVSLVGDGKTGVVKSTVLPGSTEILQEEFPKKILLHSPEFLSVATAAEDAAQPTHNIIGVPKDTSEYRAAARKVLTVLPKSPSEKICLSHESELFKYLRNAFFYVKLVYMNTVYDVAEKLGARWEVFKELMHSDPWISSEMHIEPVHKSGRGAGGGCLIKDFAAFADFYKQLVHDEAGAEFLDGAAAKNKALLEGSGKDRDILRDVYGDLKSASVRGDS